MSTNGIEAALDDHFGDLAPLVLLEIGAGRVVAAAVEQGDVARLAARERVDHLLEADRRPARARNRDIRPSRGRPRG